MKIRIDKKNDVVVISPEGSIDSKTAGDAQSQIMNHVVETDKIVLLFTKVDFVSSAGLRLLLMIYRQIKSKNGKVILVDVSDEIKEVMEMTGFINFFDFSDNLNDALNSF